MLKSSIPSRETPKSAQTRAHLLEVALELFQRRSFERTTMRELASAAGLSLGAFYYHFRTKEEVIFALYRDTIERLAQETRTILLQTTDFESRMFKILVLRHERLYPHREFFRRLAHLAASADPAFASSAQGLKRLREVELENFAEILEGCDLIAPKELKPYLPRLLWLYHLGILYHWTQDRSREQERTYKLVRQSLKLIALSLRLLTLPLTGSLIEPMVEMLRESGAPVHS